MEMTVERKELVEPTVENFNKILDKISQFAEQKGYILDSPIELPSGKIPSFKSGNHRKVVRNYCTRLMDRVTMSQANKFLHTLFKHVYKEEKAPRVEYSEREIQIKDARKAWKKVQIEADRLLKIYKEAKGDFYKKKEVLS